MVDGESDIPILPSWSIPLSLLGVPSISDLKFSKFLSLLTDQWSEIIPSLTLSSTNLLICVFTLVKLMQTERDREWACDHSPPLPLSSIGLLDVLLPMHSPPPPLSAHFHRRRCSCGHIQEDPERDWLQGGECQGNRLIYWSLAIETCQGCWLFIPLQP